MTFRLVSIGLNKALLYSKSLDPGSNEVLLHGTSLDSWSGWCEFRHNRPAGPIVSGGILGSVRDEFEVFGLCRRAGRSCYATLSNLTMRKCLYLMILMDIFVLSNTTLLNILIFNKFEKLEVLASSKKIFPYTGKKI
jgi:hypothetical protein